MKKFILFPFLLSSFIMGQSYVLNFDGSMITFLLPLLIMPAQNWMASLPYLPGFLLKEQTNNKYSTMMMRN